MKRLKYLSVLVLSLVVLNSCSSDDDTGDGGSTIAGSWKITSFSFSNNYDLNNDGVALSNVLEETGCNEGDRLLFNADGSGEIQSDAFLLNISADDLIIEEDDGTITAIEIYGTECEEDDFNVYEITFTWTQDGNTITTTTAFNETIIYTLSGNTLTNFIPNSYFLTVIENGEQTGNVTEDVTLTYSKQ
jgi:hypothetical protein